jgi:hypothetical protein
MEPSPRKSLKAKGPVVALAAVWALLVGGLMAGAAALFGVDESDAILVGVLGGLGSAG